MEDKSEPDKKAKENCFHYGKPGHWKRNCPVYLASLKQNKPAEGILVIEMNLIDGPLNSWCLDSGTTSHSCTMLLGFKETRRLDEGEIILKMGMTGSDAATGIRTFHVSQQRNKVLILEDCLYVPECRRNLISVSKLGISRYSLVF